MAKWRDRACLRVSGLLKWGIFTGCALKIRTIFMQNLVSVTWETSSFILKAKLHLLTLALLLHLSFFDCLVARILHFFGQFRGQREVLVLAKIHPVGNYFPQKIVFYYQTFLLPQICSL